MAKYEWLDLEKTKLKMKINQDGSLFREVSPEDGNYISWAAEEGNVAESPAWMQMVIDSAAQSSSE